MIRKHCSTFLASIAIAFLAANTSHAQSTMTRHLREATLTGEARLVGRMPAVTPMTLDLVLPLRDPAGLKSLLSDLYNPRSEYYHQFLTVPEFTERFGPTQEDYAAVVAFARDNGLAVIGGSRDGMEVQVKGPVAAIESAFHVTMHTYQHPTEARTFYAPDREPTVNLPFNLWHISGLDNYSLPHPLFVKRSDYAKANGISPEGVVAHATTGSGPSASFLGSDMRAAYYGTGSLTGAGQNLGLWEYVGTDLADLTTYYKNIGQTNKVPITLLSTDGTPTTCVDSPSGGNCDDTEQTLDMTQALGMAPGLASLVVYVGSYDTSIIAAMTTHKPLPTTIGCSWGWTPVDPSTLDPYFQKMAAQGQNFFAASGDSSTWSAKNEAWPADDAYVVGVGGTDLVTTKAGGPWASEMAWVDSGGGVTPDNIAIPSWQKLPGVITTANKGSSTLRNGPDVSANANFTFYTCSDQSACLANEYGGTSFAAPMWAGYLALVNQQLAANGKPPIGFLNPTIYAQNVTSAYAADFHDITVGSSGSYAATTGYDLVTGWGSPNSGLLAALTSGSTTPTPAFTLAASPVAVSVAPGSSGTSTITTAVSGGFSSAIALSSSGAPTGVTVSFKPASIASPGSGTSAVTFTVASTAKAGTYPITISGTGGGITHTAVVTLTVTVPSSFSITASPATISISQGSSGTVKLSTAVAGGFNSAVLLSASGQGSGQTVSFSPASITAPGAGSSTMTIKTATNATGTATITVTATGGGKVQTATVTLTITKAKTK